MTRDAYIILSEYRCLDGNQPVESSSPQDASVNTANAPTSATVSPASSAVAVQTGTTRPASMAPVANATYASLFYP